MKRALRIILCVLLVCILSVTAFTETARAESGTEGNLKWVFDENSTMTVSAVDPSNPGVLSSSNSFMSRHCAEIKKLVVGAGIQKIRHFYTGSANSSGVTILSRCEEVQLSSGLKTIEGYTFLNCTTLKKVNIPATVTQFGSAFYGCTGLEDVTLEYGLKTISTNAFNKCTSLKKITIPASVTVIESFPFYGCTELKEIYFLGDKPDIADDAFKGVTATVYTPENNNTWNSTTMVNYGGDLAWANAPAPVISVQPVDVPTKEGTDATFNVDASGLNEYDTLTFQWQAYINGRWIKCPGSMTSNSTSKTLTINSVRVKWDGFQFRCLVTGKNGKTATSATVTLRIITQPVISKLTNGDTDGGITITREDNSAAYYTIERKVGNGSWTILQSGKNFRNYEDTKATKMGSKYIYRIVGYLYGISTGYSEEKSLIRNPFSDVKTTDGYFTKLCWAYNKGIIKGTSTTTFSPADTCTRGQFAIMIWRLKGCPSPKMTKSPFSDIKYNATSNQVKAILWAYENKIIDGYKDGTFKPNNTCTRGQIVIMLWKTAGKPEPGSNVKNPFTDVSSSLGENQVKAILWAVDKGITKGYSDNTFRPSVGSKRSDIVTFLYRFNDLK